MPRTRAAPGVRRIAVAAVAGALAVILVVILAERVPSSAERGPARAEQATVSAPDVTAATAAAQATPFVPAPCPEQAWQYADPAFAPLPGARAFFGRYEGGLYQIELPETWNGELVLFAHGYYANTGPNGSLLRAGDPRFLRAHLIEQGFAWATSSYRCNGYVPGVGLQDTLLLRDLFVRETGGERPRRTYLAGTSMGGHVTVLGLHQFPTAFDGGLAFCPSGPALFDFFLATTAAAEAVTGEQFTTQGDVAATTARILEQTGRPGQLTAAGRQLASIQINISGGPRPFAVQGLGLDGNRFAANITGAMLAGSPYPFFRAATNEHIDYAIGPGLGLSAAELNAAVRRQAAAPALRGADGPYNELKPFDGRIERPLLSLQTTGDMWVPFFLQQVLRRAVDDAGQGDLLVQRIIRAPGHCAFSAAEAIQAFDDLVRWVREDVRPEGDDVFSDLRDAGHRFTNPIRPGDPGSLDIEP